MSSRDSFHHGHLRAELLERAEEVLRERGVDGLSLRELARDAGVSHAAPRAHFIDRAALIDALAVRGFDRLTDTLVTARADSGGAVGAMRAAARGYLEFAVDNPALLTLMTTAKVVDASGPVHDAWERLVAAMVAHVSAVRPTAPSGSTSIDRLTLLLSTTLQGVSSVVAAGRVTALEGEHLLDDAISVFLAGTSVDSR